MNRKEIKKILLNGYKNLSMEKRTPFLSSIEKLVAKALRISNKSIQANWNGKEITITELD